MTMLRRRYVRIALLAITVIALLVAATLLVEQFGSVFFSGGSPDRAESASATEHAENDGLLSGHHSKLSKRIVKS
jgi:uncharacterized membrane protein YdfJ with MMPL/SSD domain